MLNRKEALEDERSKIDERITALQKFKRVLFLNDDALAVEVAALLREGFGFSVDESDEFREDLKILDGEKKVQVFVEVKGTNTGVKREHVNQADSHRERAGLPSNFPTVLVMNTHIKNARTLDEKDKPVPSDQVEKASKDHVVILRTLDLLALLELAKKNAISAVQVLEIFRGAGGWLQVWGRDVPLLMTK